MTTIITGVDPGLVHTGVVHLIFGPNGDLKVEHAAMDGSDVVGTIGYANLFAPKSHIFIEAYRPRGNTYGTDAPMRELMAGLGLGIKKGKVIDNTGVKQVVKEPLMRLLGCWNFGTRTHHQDLRSAARIGIFGALKDPELNTILYNYVTKELDK